MSDYQAPRLARGQYVELTEDDGSTSRYEVMKTTRGDVQSVWLRHEDQPLVPHHRGGTVTRVLDTNEFEKFQLRRV